MAMWAWWALQGRYHREPLGTWLMWRSLHQSLFSSSTSFHWMEKAWAKSAVVYSLSALNWQMSPWCLSCLATYSLLTPFRVRAEAAPSWSTSTASAHSATALRTRVAPIAICD
ncbi:hypothetical protein D1793_19280 [Halomonas sp. JS92-SW72]|nr:hypothetical protein D1793_19280 [Halomonas sp. JS92-SW72]